MRKYNVIADEHKRREREDAGPNMNMKIHFKALGLAAGLLWAFLPAARAQEISLAIGNNVPVQNALKRNLPGSNGNPSGAVRVEIRETTAGGGIAPPDPVTGEGSDANPLVRESYLGHDTIGIDPGLFSETFTGRLSTNITYYARVYDAPTPEAALYFANSATFSGPPSYVDSLSVTFGALQLVSGVADEDADGDGIPTALEEDMGLDPNSPDSDGDGYPDWFEGHFSEYMHASEKDPGLDLQINPPLADAANPHTVSWQTIPVPGMTYRLQYTDALPYEDPYVAEVWSGALTDTNKEVDVEDWVANSLYKGYFRVVVPYDGP